MAKLFLLALYVSGSFGTTCDPIRGLTAIGPDTCACDGTQNFEWDDTTSTCICATGYVPSIDGQCRANTGSDSVLWSADWESCSGSSRKRILKNWACTLDSAATAAPWYSCAVTRNAVTEACNTTDSVICVDYNAEYNATSEVCECSDGYTATTFGCQMFTDITSAAVNDIVDEILTRVTAMEATGNYAKLTSKKTKWESYWNQMKSKAGKRAEGTCGVRSRAANPMFYSELLSIYSSLASYSSEEDTDLDTLTNLVKLFDTYMKQGIFNCENSGYGSDPSDGSTDTGGVTCSNANKKASFKCRVQYRFKAMYNKAFGADTLTFE